LVAKAGVSGGAQYTCPAAAIRVALKRIGLVDMSWPCPSFNFRPNAADLCRHRPNQPTKKRPHKGGRNRGIEKPVAGNGSAPAI
jgi:hypothetical protein